MKRNASKNQPPTDPDATSVVVDRDEELGGSPRPPTANATTHSSPTTPRTTNPAIVLLRKLLHTLTEYNNGGGTNAFIKDAIIGITIGCFMSIFILFLDYHNVIRLGHTRALRSAALKVMSDPATLKSIEDSMDVKLVPMEGYDAMVKDIVRYGKEMEEAKQAFDDSEKDGEEKKNELAPVKAEYDKVMMEASSKLGLDKWCDECKWGGPGNCGSRAQFLKDTYSVNMMSAKLGLIKDGKCVK